MNTIFHYFHQNKKIDTSNAILILNDMNSSSKIAGRRNPRAKTANLEVIANTTDLWNKRTIMQIPNMFLENGSFLCVL